MQYFENKRKKDYSEVINALKTIGANKHAEVLEKAENEFRKKNRKMIESVEEYVEIALEGESLEINIIPEVIMSLEWLFTMMIFFSGYLFFKHPQTTTASLIFRITLLAVGVVGLIAIKIIKKNN